MSIKKKAENNFTSGLNCAQSVIDALSREIGLDRDTAKAISIGFGGGMGRKQKTCGAVSGGIMAIGWKHYDSKDLKGSKEKAYTKTREFINKFEEKHSSSDCSILLGVDLNTEEGKAKYKEANMSKLKCMEYVKDACNIYKDII